MMDAPHPKPPVEANQLAVMVERRLRTVPLLRAAIEHDPAFAVRIGLPTPHERDSRGRNWDITAFRTGFVHWPQAHAEFRAIVDELRLAYDMS